MKTNPIIDKIKQEISNDKKKHPIKWWFYSIRETMKTIINYILIKWKKMN